MGYHNIVLFKIFQTCPYVILCKTQLEQFLYLLLERGISRLMYIFEIPLLSIRTIVDQIPQLEHSWLYFKISKKLRALYFRHRQRTITRISFAYVLVMMSDMNKRCWQYATQIKSLTISRTIEWCLLDVQ